DGNLWFTDYYGQIGRITTSGVITVFQAPGPSLYVIVSGPDGNLWFTEGNPYPPFESKIERVTTGGVFTDFQVPTANSVPFGLTAGPNGTLWFTETRTNIIGKISVGQANTLAGTNVVVKPVDSTTGTTPVTLTFSTVTQGGTTTLTTSGSG